MTPCPRCEAKGRAIESVTLEAQVVPDRLAQLAEHEGWRLCTSDSCEVVYFRDNEVVVLGETRGVPFHKSEDPQRLVCFCFGHSVAELEADVAANRTSTIQSSIKDECKAGRDDCQRKRVRCSSRNGRRRTTRSSRRCRASTAEAGRVAPHHRRPGLQDVTVRSRPSARTPAPTRARAAAASRSPWPHGP
jgi:hypothetical protein